MVFAEIVVVVGTAIEPATVVEAGMAAVGTVVEVEIELAELAELAELGEPVELVELEPGVVVFEPPA